MNLTEFEAQLIKCLETNSNESFISYYSLRDFEVIYRYMLPNFGYIPTTKEKFMQMFELYGLLLANGIRLKSFDSEELLRLNEKELLMIYFKLFNATRKSSKEDLAKFISNHFNRLTYYEASEK